MQNGTPRNNYTPAVPNPYNTSSTYPSTYSYNSHNYSYTYKHRASLTTTAPTRAPRPAARRRARTSSRWPRVAKQQGVLIITIGYNLNGSTMCSGNNSAGSMPGSNTHDRDAVDQRHPTDGVPKHRKRDPAVAVHPEDVLRAERDGHLHRPADPDVHLRPGHG